MRRTKTRYLPRGCFALSPYVVVDDTQCAANVLVFRFGWQPLVLAAWRGCTASSTVMCARRGGEKGTMACIAVRRSCAPRALSARETNLGNFLLYLYGTLTGFSVLLYSIIIPSSYHTSSFSPLLYKVLPHGALRAHCCLRNFATPPKTFSSQTRGRNSSSAPAFTQWGCTTPQRSRRV